MIRLITETIDCFKNIASSLIGCRFDYANSTLEGISVTNISPLRHLQSMPLVLSHVSGGLISISKTLQELPIKWCIDYKVATLTYKLLESGEPTYLRSRITSKILLCVRWSSVDDRQLEPCSSHTKIEPLAFCCAAPAIWNCLPYDIRAVPSVSIFRSRIKRHYFKPFNVLLWF